MRTEAKKPKVWEQSVRVKKKVNVRTYRCPVCNIPLFSVRTDIKPKDDQKEVVKCPNGHSVKVPSFPEITKIF